MTEPSGESVHVPTPAGAEALLAGETAPHPTIDYPLPVIAAGMFVGTVALMILGVQPVVLGALAQARWVSAQQVGPLATTEVLAIALGSAIGPAVLRSGAMRLKTAALSLGLAAANMGVYVVHDVLSIDALRGVAGLLEGLALGATLVVTTYNSQPDRLNALFLALSTAPQAVMAYLLPIWITPRFGPQGGFAVLAILSVLSAASALFLVDAAPLAPAKPGRPGRARWRPAVYVSLAAVGLQNAAIGGAWDYVELLAVQRHFPASLAGIAVSGGLIFQVAGAFAVAAWGRRLPFLPALIAGSLCQAGIIALIGLARTEWLYIAPALAFGLFWLAMSPFQVRLLVELDPTRSSALLLTAVTLVGLSAGPSLCALGVVGPDVAGAFWIAAAIMLCGCATYAGILAAMSGRSGRSRPTEPA